MHTGAIDSSASMPQQRWVAVNVRGGRAMLMDWSAEFFELAEQGLERRTRSPAATTGRLAADGALLLLNTRDGLVSRRWLEPGTDDRLFTKTRDRVPAFVVSPDGEQVLVARPGGGWAVVVIDGQVRWEVDVGGRRVTALAWSPDRGRVAVGEATGLVRRYALNPPRCAGAP